MDSPKSVQFEERTKRLRLHRTNSSKAALLGVLKFKSLMKLKIKARQQRLNNDQKKAARLAHRISFLSGQRMEGDESTYGTEVLVTDSDEGDYNDEEGYSNWASIVDSLTGSYTNLLLLLIPFGLISPYVGWGETTTFVLNFLSILPLAQLLGEFTEEIAAHTNDTIGALINATLGNATELIISIFAIRRGLLRVVQVSMLGSVLSNQLLVAGCCFFFGGLKFSEQKFNSKVAAIDSSLLSMAVLGLTIPAAFSATVQYDCDVRCANQYIVPLSHATAVLLFFLYILLLIFQLKTHKHIMEVADSEAEDSTTMEMKYAVGCLVVITMFVSLCSEKLVDSIESVSNDWGLTKVFIGLILLPIIGNAAEHATAIQVAMNNKMDLALGVALGSSIQISLCVVPALVLAAWISGSPLTLDFHPFETIVLWVSVMVVSTTVKEGSATWLEGACLLVSYGIISLAYFYRNEKDDVVPTCICGQPCCDIGLH